MNANIQNLPGFDIPTFDTIKSTYVGVTNNPSTIEYWRGGPSGRLLATLTLTYVGGAPGADDADVAQIVCVKTNA